MLTAALSKVCLTYPCAHPISLSKTSFSSAGVVGQAKVMPGRHGAASGGLRGRQRRGGGGGACALARVCSPEQRSSPLSCFSEPRKAPKSSRWSEQMVPVLGPAAKPENRLHLLGAHKGWETATGFLSAQAENADSRRNAHPSKAGTGADCSAVATNTVHTVHTLTLENEVFKY